MPAAFLTRLVFEDDGGLPFTLVEPLVFESVVVGRHIVVPAGFKTDLASIPRALWNILPPVGGYDAGAVVHDLLYQRGAIDGVQVSRGDADKVLREGMEVHGVGVWTRRLIYAGVRVGGWVVWRKYRKDAAPAAV